MEPEQAIAAFERLHGVVVAVHDHAGSLVHRLPQRRLRHEHRLCRAVKAAGFERTCVAGDVQALAAEAVRHPDGFLKACHAGLVELVLPVCEHGELRWTIFAGPWRDASAPAAVRQARSSARIDGAPSLPGAWPDLLDALRNLAARLATLRPPALPLPATRREAIDRFLLLRHGEDVGLPDLAAELGLSPSRTSHAVAALYGRPFARLLVEAAESARSDDYRSAFLKAYLASIAYLDEAEALRFARSRTNWEYLRELRGKGFDEVADHLFPLTASFDRKFYGREECTRQDYERALAAFGRIADTQAGAT